MRDAFTGNFFERFSRWVQQNTQILECYFLRIFTSVPLDLKNILALVTMRTAMAKANEWLPNWFF